MDNKDKNAGFTLIELGVVLIIVGIVIGFLMHLILPNLERMRVVSTQEKLEKVVDRLAAFALKNNRLPCPARPDGSGTEPFGYEFGSGANGANPNTTCFGSDVEGIIPFMTLGITQEDVTDGWDRLITYRISPVFSLNTDTVGGGLDPAEYNNVHLACRNIHWYAQTASASVNLNPAKARFCCPPRGPSPASNYYPTTDIVINDADGNAIWTGIRSIDNTQYDDVDTPVADIDEVDPTLNPEVLLNEAIAFVLISHGANTYGAFDGNGPATRFPISAQAGDSETENQDGDNVFVLSDYSTQDNNSYFDDILVWRTQHQFYTEFGDDTCLNP